MGHVGHVGRTILALGEGGGCAPGPFIIARGGVPGDAARIPVANPEYAFGQNSDLSDTRCRLSFPSTHGTAPPREYIKHTRGRVSRPLPNARATSRVFHIRNSDENPTLPASITRLGDDNVEVVRPLLSRMWRSQMHSRGGVRLAIPPRRLRQST